MKNLLYIAFLLIASSCSYSASHIHRELDLTADLIQTDPVAAMERLNAYDLTEFQDSALMARWALLYSEALVANRIAAPTDTIVNIAIDYYAAHRCNEKLRHASRLKALLRDGGDEDALGAALYLQKEKEFMLYRERIGRQRTAVVFIAVLLVAVAVILWQRQRLKLQSARNETLIAEASALRCDMERSATLCADMQLRLGDLLRGRFDLLDRLCDSYYESQGTPAEQKSIASKVKSQIARLQSDSTLLEEMERCVDDCRGVLMGDLRRALPALKPDDCRLALFLACGLSNRTIAVLLGENIDVVYKRKSRLKARVVALGSPAADRFLPLF